MWVCVFCFLSHILNNRVNMVNIPIYVINLDVSAHRWKQVQEVLGKQQIVATRVSAVDGRSMTQADLLLSGVSLRTTLSLVKPPKAPRCHHWVIDAKGAIGCTLSHAVAWRRIIATGSPYAVVLEDDAVVHINFCAHLTQLTANNLYGCDLMLLTAPFGERDRPGAFVGEFTGTAGYCLSQQAAQVLLRHAYPIEQHVDHYISTLGQLGLLNTGTTGTALISTSGDQSTIAHGFTLSDAFCMRKSTFLAWGCCLMVTILILFHCIRKSKVKNSK